MVEPVLRSRRRKVRQQMATAAVRYAGLGWPVSAGAWLRDRQPQQATAGRACSCDRIGCPAPGAHPLSPAWKREATADPAVVEHWWSVLPQASILLVTGWTFDVLDVPGPAGSLALARLDRAGTRPGPVAVGAGDRTLFFVASRAAQGDEDEWWSCHLDCEPETVPAVAGLRWHCRDSYVLAPPSRLTSGLAARWLAEPGEAPLPDALRLLEFLADACEEISQ